MIIAIGADHRGYSLKERIKHYLKEQGHQLVDLGTDSVDPVDYPDYGIAVAEKVASGEVDRGIIICGSGIGMSIAANKVVGIRAALCRDIKDAEMSRKHNNANVLALSADIEGEPGLEELIHVWLTTSFEGGRHRRRIDKIGRYERNSG
jgi:ribose 5-phosphate isomerase B